MQKEAFWVNERQNHLRNSIYQDYDTSILKKHSQWQMQLYGDH